MLNSISKVFKGFFGRRYVSIVLVICFLILFNTNNILRTFSTITIAQKDPQLHFKSMQCPSVLQHMVYGDWKQREMSKEEDRQINKFLDDARAQYGLNITLQRNDSICGNVSFPHKKGSNMFWFRGLCDRRGKTPCCYNNVCVDKTPEQCVCDNCYDMRKPLQAEYSEFTPYDRRCGIKKFTHQEACELLSGSTLALIGDSFIRHIYTALIQFLKNNYYDGALKKGVPKTIHDQCTGMYMFTEKTCRLYLNTGDTGDICGGKVKLLFAYFYSSGFRDSILSVMRRKLLDRPKSLMLFGIGLHDKLNATRVEHKIIKPVSKLMQKHTWPHLLWTTPHCPGILKNGNIGSQSKSAVLKYMSEISTVLSPLNIPIFNTYNMTDGMMSFDGSHFGQGINLLKVQLLLNYIEELRDKGLW